MAMFEQLEASGSADVGWVRAVDRVLRHAPPADLIEGMGRFAVQMDAPPDLIPSLQTPPLGIHAAGLVRVDRSWTPGLVVMDALAPEGTFDSPAPLSDQGGLLDALASLPVRAPDEAVVVGIRPPTAFYAEVEGTLTGTLGVPVRLADGRRGALTAGHVAEEVGAVVQVGPLEGEVVYSNHRARHPFPTTCADVAVIALEDGWRDTIAVPSVAGTAVVGQLDLVGAHGSSGEGAPARLVRTLGESFAISEDEACWGDFLIADAISTNGDSGSIVHEGPAVVGQIVGGLPGGYSIAQKIDYLLTDAGVELDI